ncbi:MAG: phosphatase PAP2 family protein [Treponema sp.]|nr:phosphatase PAP2 family protein [Treponema sp.]
MDILYLLKLQDLRFSFSSLEYFFAFVSELATSPAIVILVCLYYWAYNKKNGFFIIMLTATSQVLNQFIKNTACVYRPWIRDSRISCSPFAIEEAKGYSFTSGHTIMAGSSAGGIAFLSWQKRKYISLLCIVYILLVAFSRNFLGCHTPQDVLVAMLESFVLIFALSRCILWLEKNPSKHWVVFLLSIIFTIAYLLYTQFKPYPLDYVNNKLLVDPYEMKTDSFKVAGCFFGLALGSFIESKCINFSTENISNKIKFIRSLIGLVCAATVLLGINPLLKSLISDANICGFIRYTLLFLTATACVPALFTFVEKRFAL